MNDTMRKRLALLEELRRDGELGETAAAILVLAEEVRVLGKQLEEVSCRFDPRELNQ